MVSCVGLLLWCPEIEAHQKSGSRKPRSQATSQPSEKRLEEIHRLIFSGKYGHEDVATLLEIGDRASIPALLKVLKDNPASVQDKDRVRYPLKTIYAVEALRKITGLNMGASYKEWNDWWEKNQKFYVRK